MEDVKTGFVNGEAHASLPAGLLRAARNTKRMKMKLSGKIGKLGMTVIAVVVSNMNGITAGGASNVPEIPPPTSIDLKVDAIADGLITSRVEGIVTVCVIQTTLDGSVTPSQAITATSICSELRGQSGRGYGIGKAHAELSGKTFELCANDQITSFPG